MKIVADTNTFIAVALDEPEKDTVIRLTTGRDLVAPEVLPFEVGNALSAMVKKRVLNAENIIAVWEVIRQIPVKLQAIDIRSALETASRYNIYAYDAYFLECALGLRCPLLTLDSGMKKIALNMGVKLLE